jgi:peptidyl-prolyl cis-trans isomerase C
VTRLPLKNGRLGALAGALALCAGLTSCDTVPAKAATVNGSDIRRADFERDIKALAANPSLLNLTGGTERSIQGDAARNWLGQLITWQAAEDLLAARGLSVSADATKQIQGQLATGPAAELPQSMKDEIVQGAASIQSLDQVPAPSKADLEALYADVPASTGALCARHILVKTEDEANAVLDELAAGADFSELAKQRSIEATTKDSGGALVANDGNACRPLGDYQTGFDPSFTAGALAAEPGVPSGPVQTTDGWHVILIRPFDEVADDLVKLVGTAPGDAALTGVLGTAQVTVDPRYGRWDQVKANVVSLH